jgi:glycoside/pentoside/hexuronide:cation symporter, GPH family
MPVPQASPSASNRLPLREKIGFGLGDFGNNLYWQFFMYFLLYFYTDIYRIAPGEQAAIVAGQMFFIVRALNALFDVVVGVVADRTRSRWGRYRPYLLIGAIPFGVAGMLAFTTPDFEGTARIAYAYATYALLMTIYSAVSIPQNALLGVVTADSQERTVVSKYKFVFAFSAGLVVQFCTPLLVRFFGDGDGASARGYQLTLFVYAAVAVVLLLVCFAVVRERVTEAPARKQSSLREDARDLLGNVPWLILCAVTLFSILCIAIRSGTFIYWFKYYVGAQTVSLPGLGERTFSHDQLFSGFLVLGTLVTILGTLLVPVFTRLFGKRLLFALMMGGSSLVTALYALLEPTQVGLIFGLQIAVSILLGPTSALLWAMYADCADFSEWKNERRATGLVFSAAIMAQKFGWTLGAALPLWLLAVFGYAADAEMSDHTRGGIVLVNTLIPAGFGLLSALLVLAYPLTERKLGEIGEDLARRRESTPTPSPS